MNLHSTPAISGRHPAAARYLASIFVVALVSLAYQVLLTRIFSVMLQYHFSFAGISFAMLGLMLGAEHVYKHEARYQGESFTLQWARAALLFALSSVLTVLWFMYCPLLLDQTLVLFVLLLSMLLFIIPFIYSGICVTLLLTRSPLPVGRVYAYDLVGAAIGCAGIVLLLFVLDPISLLMFGAMLVSATAWWMVYDRPGKIRRYARILTIIWITLATAHAAMYLVGDRHLGLQWNKRGFAQEVLFERWNALSYVRVIPYEYMVPADKKDTPFGWGIVKSQDGRKIEQKYLDIDADAGTVITKFSGDISTISYLADDIINFAYHVRKVQSTLAIGVGGGRDILSAIYFGVEKIAGVEINPAIFEALTQVFAEFSGNLHQRQDVKLINAEARSWLKQSQDRYDFIQISLIDTWAATAGGGLTLSENKLYTVEAWQGFIEKLHQGGMLSVSRWFKPGPYRGEFYRLLSIAVESLKKIHPTGQFNPRQHILAFHTDSIITVIVSPSAFSAEEVVQAIEKAHAKGFAPAMTPDHALDEISAHIASGAANAEFYSSLPVDVTATTDNKPFFFFMTRFADFIFQGVDSINKQNFINDTAIAVLTAMLGATGLIMLYFMFSPFPAYARTIDLPVLWKTMAYFALIGMGFMLIEISQMQRLMIFLGHPIYGLSVILFTLLLFGGIGSLYCARILQMVSPQLLSASVLVVLVAVGVLTPHVAELFATEGTVLRIIFSVVLLAPAGFMMGVMFPMGMRLCAQHGELHPWLWSVNGATSVFASVLGMVLSIQWGISTTYWSGVACYIGCAVLIVLLHRPISARAV